MEQTDGGRKHNFDPSKPIQTNELMKNFEILVRQKGSIETKEIVRQKFLKIIGRSDNVWRQSQSIWDEGIEVCKLSEEDNVRYLALMRIAPGGFKCEQILPTDSEMTVNTLHGDVQIYYKNSIKNMTRGKFLKIRDDHPYALKNLQDYQSAYLAFSIIDRTKSFVNVDADIINNENNATESQETQSDKQSLEDRTNASQIFKSKLRSRGNKTLGDKNGRPIETIYPDSDENGNDCIVVYTRYGDIVAGDAA